MDKVGILIIDNDEASRSAVQQLLDSEGWHVKIANTDREAMQALATGNWTLVVANTGTIGLSGVLYATLKELAHAAPAESGKSRVRVLFMIPEVSGLEGRTFLENERLPYVLMPLNLHDFLERVSDLLMETEAITAPIRRVRLEWSAAGQRTEIGAGRNGTSHQQPVRNQGMFANRDDWGMTEEEIMEFERTEAELQRKKKKKRGQLGD